MSDLAIASLVDWVVVGICAILLIRKGKLSHSHPGTVYLAFHVLSFSVRTLGVALGASTLFSDVGRTYSPVRSDEIVRASLTADAALVGMTSVWLWLASRRKEVSEAPDAVRRYHQVSEFLLIRMCIIVIPIGLIALLLEARLPGIRNQTINYSNTSSYIIVLQAWTGLALLALMYVYGFRWKLVVPLSAYLLVMALQGGDRFRVVIPVIIMTQIYLGRSGRRWPTLGLGLLLLATLIVFYPLKTVGSDVAAGDSPSHIMSDALPQLHGVVTGSHPDQTFEDEYAAALTLADEAGYMDFGQHYLALITLPIPRQWWPNKPGVADEVISISRPWRPLSTYGAVLTILGDAYLSFGYPGLLLIPMLFALLYGMAYFGAYRRNYMSVARMTYLLVTANLITVYRDGLSSVVVFTAVNMMPLAIYVALEFLTSRSRAGMETEGGYRRPNRRGIADSI